MNGTSRIRRVQWVHAAPERRANPMLRTRITTAVGLAIAVCLATAQTSAGRAASPAAVSFHFMQIEQVIIP